MGVDEFLFNVRCDGQALPTEIGQLLEFLYLIAIAILRNGRL